MIVFIPHKVTISKVSIIMLIASSIQKKKKKKIEVPIAWSQAQKQTKQRGKIKNLGSQG